MSRIRVVKPDESDGNLRTVYDEIARSRGSIANIMQVQGMNPPALKAHLSLYMALMFGQGNLSRRERELIAVVTSGRNGCRYCVSHHSDALNRYVKDKGAVDRISRGELPDDLSMRERTLAHWAETLTKSPSSVDEAEVERLRSAGFSDGEILDATLIVAYFNFVNRIAVALGVNLEADKGQDYRY